MSHPRVGGDNCTTKVETALLKREGPGTVVRGHHVGAKKQNACLSSCGQNAASRTTCLEECASCRRSSHRKFFTLHSALCTLNYNARRWKCRSLLLSSCVARASCMRPAKASSTAPNAGPTVTFSIGATAGHRRYNAWASNKV